MGESIDTHQYSGTSAKGANDLLLDHGEYYDDLASLDISEDQKRELLETMWSIMRLFVELGFSCDVAGRAIVDIFNRAARDDDRNGA